MRADRRISCAENNGARSVRHHTGRTHWFARLSEPIRQVLAAWIVAVFFLVAGLSVLAFHEHSVRDDGVAAVTPRWYPPPVAGAEEPDEVPCRDGIWACSTQFSAEHDSARRMIAQFGSGAARCSAHDHEEYRNLQTAAEADLLFHRLRDLANKDHTGSVIRGEGISYL
jgi:hypothetical protein